MNYILKLINDKNNKPSLSRLGYFLTVVTTIFWINIIFALYVYNTFLGKPTQDMPSQIVMLILTLLTGYIGAKGTEAISTRIHDLKFKRDLDATPAVEPITPNAPNRIPNSNI